MMLCPSLRVVQKNYVKFNPLDSEHLKAFEMLCLGQNGNIRQHPTLRFELEDNFTDVRSMMFHIIGATHLRTVRAMSKKSRS